MKHESGVTLKEVVQLHKLAAQLEASCKGRLTRHRKLPPLVSGSPVFECQMLSVEPQLKWFGIELDLADNQTFNQQALS